MTGSLGWPGPVPWPLAWHPRADGDKPDPTRFARPVCADHEINTKGGLWTSPMIDQQHSLWSVYHDVTGMEANLVRQGWALAWPAPARTATINSLEDLQRLVAAYPCTAHRSLDTIFTMTGPHDYCPLHDDQLSPPLDFAAMATEYDAVHLTEAGRQATFMTTPGTTHWSVETVLWLNPVWITLYPITTVAAPRPET